MFIVLLSFLAYVLGKGSNNFQYKRSVDEKFENIVNSLCDAWLLGQDASANIDDNIVHGGRSFVVLGAEQGTGTSRPGRFEDSARRRQVIRPGRSMSAFEEALQRKDAVREN